MVPLKRFLALTVLSLCCVAHAEQYGMRNISILKTPSGGSVTASNYDFAIPQLLATAATTTGANTYTVSLQATNGSLLLGFFEGTANSGNLADPTNVLWQSHTWIKVTNINFNTIANPSNNVTLWRTICTNTSSATLTVGYPNAQTGNSMAIFQWMNADSSEAFGSNAIVQVVAQAQDTAVNPRVTYTAVGNAGTNGLIWFCADNQNSASGRTANSSNQWQLITQSLNYNTPATGGALFFSEVALASLTAATNYASSRNCGHILVEVKPNKIFGGTNYAASLMDFNVTNAAGTTINRVIETNGIYGQFEQFDLNFSQNVQGETLTNVFLRQTNFLKPMAVRVGQYKSSNVIVAANSASFAMGISNYNNFTYFVQGRASPGNNLILAFRAYLYNGATNNEAGANLYDMLRCDGNASGDAIAFQLDTSIFASGQSNRFNIESNPGPLHSTYIAWQTNSWIYMEGIVNYLIGQCRATVWAADPANAASRTFLGDVTVACSHIGTGTGDTDLSPAKGLQVEAGISAFENRIEHLELDDSTGRYTTNIFNGLGP